MLGIFTNTGLPILPFVDVTYRLGTRQVFTATGANTYTTPANCKALLVFCVGSGGGGSASGASGAGNIAMGAGAVGGALASAFIPTIGGLTFTAQVGVGGGTGATGALTSFTYKSNGATVCQAPGGGTGAAAVAAGTTEIFGVPGNTEITAGVSDVVFGCNRGKASHRVSGTVALSGRGGSGPFCGRPVARLTQGTGAAGGNYGGGGCGGLSINAGGSANGGAGANGLVVVWEFY